MDKKLVVLFICILCSLAEKIRDQADKLYLAQKDNKWFVDGENLIKQNLKVRNINNKATGVILFLGDGMGISTVTAARILDGQLKGNTGEENVLSWEAFPNVGLSKTYNTNAQVADSAGTATAFLTGVKSFSGAISVNDKVTRGSCTNVNENSILSILEMAEIAGLSTGIVSTTRVTHATPAAAYAHSSDRNYEDDSLIPNDENCKDIKDIARQLIEFPYGDGLEVVLGGGRRGFLPYDKDQGKTSDAYGQRKDNRNLIKEWKMKNNRDQRYKYVQNRNDLKALNVEDVDHVLGLFSPTHMEYAYNRKDESSEQPSLVEMTEFAINVLKKNKKGYFLMVEGGRIDHAHHQSKAYHSLYDTVELNKAVEKAVSLTFEEETLLMVTADHSHVFTIGGYPKRGNPIFGFPDAVDNLNKRFTTLGYFNGPGAKEIRAEPTKEDVANPEYIWQSLVPLDHESHGGEDVGIYARGAQAHLVRGVVEQNYIFHVMDYALCLSEGKNKYCKEQGLISSRKR